MNVVLPLSPYIINYVLIFFNIKKMCNSLNTRMNEKPFISILTSFNLRGGLVTYLSSHFRSMALNVAMKVKKIFV